MWKASHFRVISREAAHIVSPAVATFSQQFLVKFEAITCNRGNQDNLDVAAFNFSMRQLWTHLYFFSCLLFVSLTFWEFSMIMMMMIMWICNAQSYWSLFDENVFTDQSCNPLFSPNLRQINIRRWMKISLSIIYKYFRSAAINLGIFGIWWNLQQVVGLIFVASISRGSSYKLSNLVWDMA